MTLRRLVAGLVLAVGGGAAAPAALWFWVWAVEGRDAGLLGTVSFAAAAGAIGFCAGAAVTAARSTFRSSARRG